MEQLNYFDIAIAVLVLFFAIKGFMHGVVKEVLGLIGLVGGVYLASRYGVETGTYLSENVYAFEGKSLTFIIGFVVFLIGFWLSTLVLSAMILALTNKNGMGFFRRLLGFFAGGLKIFLVTGIFVFLLSRVDLIQQNFSTQLEHSIAYPMLVKTGDIIVDIDSLGIGEIKGDVEALAKDTPALIVAPPREEEKSLENNITQSVKTVLSELNVTQEVIATELNATKVIMP